MNLEKIHSRTLCNYTFTIYYPTSLHFSQTFLHLIIPSSSSFLPSSHSWISKSEKCFFFIQTKSRNNDVIFHNIIEEMGRNIIMIISDRVFLPFFATLLRASLSSTNNLTSYSLELSFRLSSGRKSEKKEERKSKKNDSEESSLLLKLNMVLNMIVSLEMGKISRFLCIYL